MYENFIVQPEWCVYLQNDPINHKLEVMLELCNVINTNNNNNNNLEMMKPEEAIVLRWR